MLANVFTKSTWDRWRGTTIAVVSLTVMLLFAMAVYRDIDLAIYTDLPEALRAMMNIPDGADVGSLAIGVLYGLYGAFTLAALALSMGSAAIAGEERRGTIGILLANPKSRTHVLAAKTAAMVLLIGAATLVLWGAAHVVPAILDVDMTGMRVGPYAFHLFVNALFYGFLAMAIGAWTGSRPAASGATVAVMVVSYFAVSVFPLVEGWENVARAFPWYYFDRANPVINGVHWGHIGLLVAASAIFLVAAAVGVNRRDLKDQEVGVTLIDRLRANPMTQKVADRLAGSTRVSRIWIKTASEHQGLLLVTALVMFFMMGVMMGPFYTLFDQTVLEFADEFPEAILAAVGGGDMSTAEGWYQVETFGLMAPIAVMVVTVAIGARALAGEEARRTMGLLLANPIPRSRVVLEKAWAMTVYGLAVGLATFAGVAAGSLLGRLGMDIGDIAATSLLVTLLGLAFGGLALSLSAATGRVKIAVFAPIAAALGFHLLNAFLPLNDSLAGYARWSPFYYYLTSDPLTNGMHWGHGAVLAGLTVALVGLSVVLFQRRDLRQPG